MRVVTLEELNKHIIVPFNGDREIDVFSILKRMFRNTYEHERDEVVAEFYYNKGRDYGVIFYLKRYSPETGKLERIFRVYFVYNRYTTLDNPEEATKICENIDDRSKELEKDVDIMLGMLFGINRYNRDGTLNGPRKTHMTDYFRD
jgi:hypothetical protein